MEKGRIIAIVISILILFAFVAILIAVLTPPSLQPKEGPSSDGLSTQGVFKPGGYVNFELEPEINSIDGKYLGWVYTTAYRPSQTFLANEPLWDKEDDHFGKDWGDSIPLDVSKTFSVKHKVLIPNDPSLVGQTVLFYLEYKINYPRFSSGGFSNSNKTLDLTIEIDIEDTMLSEEEQAFMNKPVVIYYILLIILFFGFIFTLILALNPSKRKARL